jgi:hypothetical protein
VCSHAHTYIHAHTHTCMHIHTYIHIYVQIYIHTVRISSANTLVFCCIQRGVGRRLLNIIYIQTYTHIHTHTYIHTYIHTYSADFLGTYAGFLFYTKGDLEKASQYYLKAVELDGTHIDNLGAYAGIC